MKLLEGIPHQSCRPGNHEMRVPLLPNQSCKIQQTEMNKKTEKKSNYTIEENPTYTLFMGSLKAFSFNSSSTILMSCIL